MNVFAEGCLCGRMLLWRGQGATPAAFYLGLCRLRCILSPACTPRLRCRRAVFNCSSDDAAAIRKSGLEIKNRCSLWAVLEGFLASIPKSGLEIKNHCTQEDISGQNMQRFPISAPELAITAAPDPFPWISLQPKGVRHGAAAEECRMGRDFGRRSRPWLREREGPAAQRWEGKHRRCAPVRSPCPQADSDAETRPLPAGRLGRGNTALPAGRLGRGNAPWKGAGVF